MRLSNIALLAFFSLGVTVSSLGGHFALVAISL